MTSADNRSTAIPTRVLKIIIGRKLEALRDGRNMTQGKAAELLHCTQNKIGNIERGESGIKVSDLNALLDGYEADPPTRVACVKLAQATSRRAPKGTLRSRFEGTMREVVDLEGSANRLWQHNCMTIPGLLQTEAYMRYLFRAVRPSMTPEDIEKSVTDRLERQQVLDNVDQHFWFIIDAAAFARGHNMDGSSAIMRGQKDHIAEMIDRPNVEVQVVPFDVGYYLGQSFNFTIFGYNTDPVVELVHVEGLKDGNVTPEPKEVNDYLTVWEHQKAAALGPEQSRTFLLRRDDAQGRTHGKEATSP